MCGLCKVISETKANMALIVLSQNVEQKQQKSDHRKMLTIQVQIILYERLLN